MTRTTHLGLPLPDFDTTPWHDDVHEAFKLIDAVLYTLTGMSSLKGTWANSTSMVVGDRYLDDVTGEVYQCVVNHTSAAASTTFGQDRTANPTYWKLIDAGSVAAVALLQASNLSDLNNTTTARTNLGVEIGADVQAWSTILDNTEQSFTSALKTKLDGIETGATADQTGAQIKAKYELEANAFTDSLFTKLSGIETAADVTDTSNVTAAGALMDSECTNLAAVKALNQGVATTDAVTFASASFTTTATIGTNILLGGKILWNVTDEISWVSTEGLYGKENGDNTNAWRLSAMASVTTKIPSIYSNTSVSAANVRINTDGELLRESSSGKFKVDRQPLDGNVILQLNPVTYVSTLSHDDDSRRAGLISEEVAAAFPEANVDKATNYDTRALVAALIALAKMQDARITQLEQRLI